MSQAQELLRVRDLTTRYFTEEGPVDALTGLDVTIDRDEVYGLVGQSGAGKTTAALSIMDAVEPPGRITAGEVWLRHPDLAERYGSDRVDTVEGEMVDLRRIPPRARRRVNRGPLRMVPEDPDHAFNPSLSMGAHLAEALDMSRPAGAQPDWLAGETPSFADQLRSLLPVRSSVERRQRARTIELLRRVGVGDPEATLESYPHELSSSVLRRVAIAEAVAPGPDLLIADEPTANLSGTEQHQLLRFLDSFRAETGMSILLLSKRPQVINSLCDRVGVLYAGELVAEGTPDEVFEEPAHPSLHRLE